LVEGITLETTNIVFDKPVRKVIKDAINHARLVSTALCYSPVLYHSFYLMTIFFYLVTTFVVLLTGAEAADKATSSAQHLPDQGAATSREG
jgi:hypothetical protein